MKRALVAILFLSLALQVNAQTRALSEKTLESLTRTADRVASIKPDPVPEILLMATIAANDPRHLARPAAESILTRQVAAMHLGALPTLERRAQETALAALLGERMTPERIAGLYAATVYYGRNCNGHLDAAHGLARRTLEQADDAVWLALAALPRSPSWYLRDRSALKDRVRDIVIAMETAALIDQIETERLKALPLASVDTGKGCSSH